jgi:hypothetical protein
MSLSTPINSLRRNGDTSSTPNFSMDNSEFSSQNNNNNFNSQSSDSQLVEDILKEMGESPGLPLLFLFTIKQTQCCYSFPSLSIKL